MNFIVRVSEQSLREMVLATVESYALRSDRRGQGAEIYGHLWGFQKWEEDRLTYHVHSVSLSLAAKGNSSSVVPDARALLLKRAVVERWYPHLTLLGDFHSHPYRDLDDVNRNKGWCFSDEDLDGFRHDDEIWASSGDAPLMLVMTICRLARVREGMMERPSRSVCRFDIGEFRFWLNACAGHVEPSGTGEEGERAITGNTRSPVDLELFPLAYNPPGDRLVEGEI